MDVIESNIDFNAYKTFYAVAKYESFSKAASELYISQPAVSYSIKKLEEELNIQLFIRLYLSSSNPISFPACVIDLSARVPE